MSGMRYYCMVYTCMYMFTCATTTTTYFLSLSSRLSPPISAHTLLGCWSAHTRKVKEVLVDLGSARQSKVSFLTSFLHEFYICSPRCSRWWEWVDEGSSVLNRCIRMCLHVIEWVLKSASGFRKNWSRTQKEEKTVKRPSGLRSALRWSTGKGGQLFFSGGP